MFEPSLGISGVLLVLESELSLSFLPASDLDSSDWSFGVTVGSDFSLLFLASVVLSTLLESSLLWSPWELGGGGSSVLKFAG
ncbi:hypothetical protein R6879_000746 [Mycoplasmopsis bovis]|nr:hypothetical protein [Mycoplasmopsis bovis]MCA8840410.1 hypothetical protein [Mycoplasmopsis bovis]